MSIITRAKNILLTPATEWGVISMETDTPQTLLGKYVIPMALIPAIAIFIGTGVIGYNFFGVHIASMSWGISEAIVHFIGSLVAYFISTYVIDALAPNFGSEKNIGRSAQLVAYSFTASWVAGIIYLLPSLYWLALLGGLYGIYLLYLGIPVLKKTSKENQIGYLLVSLLVIIVISWLIMYILARIEAAIILSPYSMGAGLNGDLKWR